MHEIEFAGEPQMMDDGKRLISVWWDAFGNKRDEQLCFVNWCESNGNCVLLVWLQEKPEIEEVDHFGSRPWLAASRFGEVGAKLEICYVYSH